MVSMMPAIEKSFDSMGDDKVKLSTENEFLENKTVFFWWKMVRGIWNKAFKTVWWW